ncbi:hypothetical protein MTR67_007548 [Solanum verrucosum]|uniref:Uncharacterized protein n=1 Tax=Solanum verrucosum TaxID=315347 RepID=A0AAF0Q0E8_SOLVR|nr:hypothetical protein MTR67_007548 [Solanum verrucosum]
MYSSLKVVETFGLEYINTGDLLRKERLRITIGDGINHETWKHKFFWEFMKPNEGGELSDAKLNKARTQQDYDTRKEANNYFRWMELNAFAGLCGLFLSKWLVAKRDKK